MSNASNDQETGNAAPLIYRLPDDVFCEIFRVGADIDRPAPDRLGFIRGSHVCQLWRAIMLDLPTLWADIICTYRAVSAVETFLERARDTPLIFDFGERRAQEMVEILVAKDALSRARVIVSMWHEISMVDWGLLLSTQALLPNLRTLKVGVNAPARILVYGEGRVDMVSAPSLEELHLRKIRLTVNAPTLRFLTLEVLFPDVSPSSTVASASNLLELLQTVALYPMLEHLTLMIDGRAADKRVDFKAPPVLDSPISLPHLRELTMRGRPATLAVIWKNLDVPQHAAVSCDLPWQPELGNFLEAGRRIFQRPQNRALFLGVKHRIFGRHQINSIVCLVSSTPENDPELCIGGCLFRIDIQWTRRGVTSLQLLEAVMSANPHIESLTLHNTSIDTAGTRQSDTQVDLTLFTNIKHLCVKGDEALAQLRTLLRVDALPALKIVDIDLDSNDDWRAVINLLRIRADASHPLDNLLLNGAIMYWDEAEQREESSLLKDVSEELHDRRKVIWKSSANLSSLSLQA